MPTFGRATPAFQEAPICHIPLPLAPMFTIRVTARPGASRRASITRAIALLQLVYYQHAVSSGVAWISLWPTRGGDHPHRVHGPEHQVLGIRPWRRSDPR